MAVFQELLHGPLFSWVVLPLLIFLARIVDVAMGTIRIIFVSRGKCALAPFLGFFESSIWLLAISSSCCGWTTPICFVAFAAALPWATMSNPD
jgi:uncharacterized protein YebE (UPF0316 family)